MGVELAELDFLLYELHEDADKDSDNIATNVDDGNFVKHSLKSKILERRHSLGLGKITVDFTPKQLYPMTEVEIEKERRRKESNRISAKRCRKKQKEEYERNRTLLEELKDENERLMKTVKETEEEKNKVLFELKKILPDSYIGESLNRINYNELYGKSCRGNNLGISEAKEPTHIVPDEELDIATSCITNERSMFDEIGVGNNDYLCTSFLNVQEDDVQTVTSILSDEIGSDSLLSFLTQ